MFAVRTSVTDPIQVAKIAFETHKGSMIGITFCPGKKQDSLIGNGRWERNLDIDLEALAGDEWQYVVTLVEDHELDQLGVADLGAKVEAYGMIWIHYPIPDGGAPAESVDLFRAQLNDLILRGKRVLIHCKGGLGRAGTVAAMALMDSGEYDFCDAVAMVRHVRPDAIESIKQMEFLMSLLGDDE